MKDYYYVSEGIVRQFPEFEKSKKFEGPFGVNCHIAVIPDFGVVEKFVNEDETDTVLFANQCVDSQVSLTYDSVDYDEDDNEIEVATELTIEVCKDWGLVTAIEQELGLTTEKNVAFVIYQLAKRSGITPIELVNEIRNSGR